MTALAGNEGATAPAKKRPNAAPGSRRHLKGPPVEVFVYRVIYGRKGRGGQREYVGNVVPNIAVPFAQRAGRGVYRLEFRDARRWVVAVRMVLVRADGSWSFVGRAKRSPGRRKHPPPWDGWRR
jgi:hypothetical protein